MNPIEELVRNFQNLVAQVPDVFQPAIVLLAGAIPFIEGEVATLIGVAGGIDPVVAAIAAAAGNFLCVLVIVLLSSGARSAVVNRRAARATVVAVGAGSSSIGAGSSSVGVVTELGPEPTKPESKGRLRFKAWLARFGVPGASILGPLAIPTQFTAAILVAGGTPRGRVLVWQAVAITIWTTISAVSAWLAFTYVVGV